MKKETFFAIMLGVITSIVISLIILSYSKPIKKEEKSSNKLSVKTSPTLSIPNLQPQPLIIETPKDKSVVASPTIPVKGKAPENSIIVIQSPKEDVVFKMENQSFTKDIPLIIGENEIKIVMYSKSDIDFRTLIVYYIPE